MALAIPRQQTHDSGTKSPPAWCRVSGRSLLGKEPLTVVSESALCMLRGIDYDFSHK
jgi:hypothetical protein